MQWWSKLLHIRNVCVKVLLSGVLWCASLSAMCYPHRSGEWSENTRDTLSYKFTSLPSPFVPLDKVIPSWETRFSSPLSLPGSRCVSLCLSVAVCLAALCHYYGPICVNANIPFIMGRGGGDGFRQGSGGLHTSPLTFSPWWHPLRFGVRGRSSRPPEWSLSLC